MLRLMVLTSLLLLVLSGTGNAGDQPQKVTLGDAIARGLAQNNQTRAASFQAKAARSAASAASLHYLPTVTLEETWSRSNVPVNTFMMKLNQGRFTNQDFDAARLNNPSPASDFRSAVSVEQPLFVPTAWAGQLAARRGAERQEALSDLSKEQIGFQIYQLYLEVQKAKGHLKSAEKGLEEARESKRQAMLRTKAGLGLKSDEMRADTHLAGMEQFQISAANNLVLTRMQLAISTGGEPGEEVDALDEAKIAPISQTLDQLIDQAGKRRLDLRAAERGKEQADAGLMQSRAGFLPMVGAFGSWQMNDHNTPLGREHDAWAAGVSLKWNVFDGFRTIYNSSQAGASRSAAVEMLEHTRKQVGYEVREAWLRRIEAEKRLAVARTALISAEEATRLLSRRFENGLATMLELLDAQTALNQARANLVESENNLLLATGRVYFTAGTFLKEVQQ